MFTRSTPDSAIDSISCVKVEVEQAPVEGAPRLELLMVYLNSKSRITYGTCPVKHNPSSGLEGVLSSATLQKFREFLESAEADWGQIVFGSGRVVEEGEENTELDAETNKPLRVGLGGGT